MRNENLENVQIDNEVIDYLNGKAIIKDANDQYFFVEMEEEFVTLGETINSKDLKPLRELEKDEIKQILSRLW